MGGEKDLDARRVSPEGPFDHPRLYLVGEAPGAEEAAEGRPFVGPAGRALDRMLDEAGIERDALRIANAVPYRPISGDGGEPRNRAPTRGEIEEHGAAVLADIRRAKPRAVAALGSSGAHLFGIRGTLEDAREGQHDFEGRPLIVTYHPAYLRRFHGYGSAKWRQAVEDLRRAWNAG